MSLIKWGILGTGNIAAKFANGLSKSKKGELYAVGSRSIESASAFAEKYPAVRAYGSYDELINDPDVQVVYISLPNHLHAEWTIKCAQAGKHILCEKPFTVNQGEAEIALEVVRQSGVFFMEAFMYRCHPQTKKLKELVDDKVVGDIRLIQANFCYNMGIKLDNIRLSNAAAGGAIMDVGCYTISLARLIAGEDPFDVKGSSFVGPESKVDEQSTGSARFFSGCVASLSCATQVATSSEARIWGSKGYILAPNPWFPGSEDNIIIVHKDGQDAEEIHVPGVNELYATEADAVAECILTGQTECDAMTWNDTLGNMRALDQWRRSAWLFFEAESFENISKPSVLQPQYPTIAGKSEDIGVHSGISMPLMMEYSSIPGIDKPVSRVIMGSLATRPDNLPHSFAMFDYYAAIGGNCIDTARMYQTEGAIGKWMTARKNREEIVVITKCSHPDKRGSRLSPEAIAFDLSLSLKELETDYIDLVLLHRDDENIPVGVIIDCLNEHIQAGNIKAFGASNWTVKRIQEANQYALEHGKAGFAASSPQFSLAKWNDPVWPGCLTATAEDIQWYTGTQFPVLTWSSQANGFFSGRYSEERPMPPHLKRVWFNDGNFERLRRVNDLAVQKGVGGAQIAIAYVLNQAFPVFALIGPWTPEEMRTSAAGFKVDLTDREMRWLNLEE